MGNFRGMQEGTKNRLEGRKSNISRCHELRTLNLLLCPLNHHGIHKYAKFTPGPASSPMLILMRLRE